MSDKHPKHPDAPQDIPEEDKGKPSPGEKKNKCSSVYLYLVILFGAAFMMLLLAYFVQQRNNEITISDLQDTMNLSRGELMAEIDQLKRGKTELESALDALTAEQEETGAELSQLRETHEQLTRDYSAACQRQELAGNLGWLEQFCAQEDWLMAAAVVEDSEALFNEQAPGYDRDREASPSPVQAARYLQLAEEVQRKSRCMATVTENEDNPEQRTEERQISEDSGAYSPQAIAAARALWDILHSYQAGDLAEAARLTAELYAGDDVRNALNGGSFRASTPEVLEQVVQTLTGAGYLEEGPDGTFTVCPPAPSSAPDSAGTEAPAQK